VVVGANGFALYSGADPVPATARRGAPISSIGSTYRREALLRLASLPPTPLEERERLEQLRALEHGIRIRVVRTDKPSLGVDTPEDLERVRRMMAGQPNADCGMRNEGRSG
jgi:3-deoxy-manno-octulosonate cytidylyltransferase (CMP-KDO synthetase)